MDNWLLIIVGVVFLISIVVGYIRGFFKIGMSLISTVLTIVLVIFLTPYVGDALIKFTPIDELIEEKCVEAIAPELSAELLEGKDLSGTPFEGLDIEELNGLSELDLERYGISVHDILGVLGEIPQEQQIQEIENSKLPHFLKEMLLENNNTMIYGELGVSTFAEYMAAYISRMVIYLLSFLVTFLIVVIIVKALMAAVDIIGELLVVGFFNHLGGAMVGVLVALMLVWLGFLVMTLLYTTPAGQATFEMIEKSKILTLLYEKNILLSKLLSF